MSNDAWGCCLSVFDFSTRREKKWDGKIEPRLLSTTSSGNLSASSSDAGIVGGGGVAPIPSSSCRASLMARSNITNYAFLDENARVRIYVELPGVGNCRDEDVLLDFTERSLCLTVKNYVPPSPKNVADTSVELVVDCTALEGAGGEDASPKRGEDRSLSLGRLYAEIEGATFRKKAERVIITLTKKDKKRAWSAVIA